MKKQIMPFLLFCGLIGLVACGGDENTTTTARTTEETTITTNSNIVKDTNVNTTAVNMDSANNSTEIVENEIVSEETPAQKLSGTAEQHKVGNKSNTTPATTTTTVKTEEINTTAKTEPKNEEKVITAVTTTTKKEPEITTKTTTKPEKKPLSHDSFNGLLQKYVNSAGRVNYSGFKNDKAKLVEYLEHLGETPPQSDWSKNKEMAFWINLYNAFTIKLILDKYPVKSIMDLNGGKVWDVQKINIGGKNYTLGQIEADKLLKRFKEPRVHFAVNCAAASCPPLLNKAWTESNIQRYYEKQAKVFVNNSNYNTLSAKSVQLSQIFNWYAGDFGGASNVLKYVQKYSETTIKDKAKVSYREYDWSLNKQ